MILIADGGSTKADWIAINSKKEEAFRVRTLGLNPAVVPEVELENRIVNMFQLMHVKEEVTEIFFYGAGCGTPIPTAILKNTLETIFVNATVVVAEDLLAAVYAATGKDPAVVCILGTGSNSCYFDGKDLHMLAPSLGYILMDEASGNYFGKKLIVDYFYKKMPNDIRSKFEKEFDLDADHLKKYIYREANPNMFLATFAKFMFDFKEEKYVKRLIKKGFQEFFKYRILPYHLGQETPIYFIGSIAHYFRDVLEKVAAKNNLKITGVIQRPIDDLVAYHKHNIG